MANPIMDMLKGSNNQNNSIPTSIDDPRLNDAKAYVNSHGGDPKSAFYQLCKEKDLNADSIVKQFFGK